jgi:ferredoxin
MIRIRINGKDIDAEEGSSLLEAAGKAGARVPALCHGQGLEHFTSCMVCLVKERGTGTLLPSCSVKVVPGMDILTEDDELTEARRTALELLLSEHAGDCEAPCRLACPAFMDIPRMNRLIAAGDTAGALEVVRRDIALPAVLGRICPAPCEGACKRKPVDEAVSVCLLKRFAADEAPPAPPPASLPSTGKRVAVIGAGPAGLSAAYYLQLAGIQAEVYDANPLPGGALRTAIPDRQLDKAVLDREVAAIRETGVVFHMGQTIGAGEFRNLRHSHDAVVVATGGDAHHAGTWGLDMNGKQVRVARHTFQTNLDGVFAIGNATRPSRLAIRSAGQGREAAMAVAQLLGGLPVTGRPRRFNSSLGRLLEQEFAEYLREGSSTGRREPARPGEGLEAGQAREEAARCLHCDCRKPDSCRLRDLAESYGASRNRFRLSGRTPVKKFMQHPEVVYEPGKCIKCGICVRLTARHREAFGFTFIGRGFDVVVGAPFGESTEKALARTARQVAAACPTGALALLSDGDEARKADSLRTGYDRPPDAATKTNET